MTDNTRDYAGIRQVTITDENDLTTVAALRARLALVPVALERWDRIAKIPPKAGSQMALDDTASGWREVSADAELTAAAMKAIAADPTESDRTVGFAEIVRDASAATGVRAAYGEMVWREISGLCHPSMMRSVRAMDLEMIVDHGEGTFGAMFTSNAMKGKYSVEAAFLAFTTAVELFGARKMKPGDPRAYASA